MTASNKRETAVLIWLCTSLVAVAVAKGELRLAGEAITFGSELQPSFTARQVRNISQPTRDGLALWAATGQGRRLISRFQSGEYEITVREDLNENGAGRAPDPGLLTLIAANDRSRMKIYALILNPSFVLPNQPASAAQMMAIIWAGEMLHIDFYSRGISLPHHQRSDFQKEWREVAVELGFPDLMHDGGDERPYRPRRRTRR